MEYGPELKRSMLKQEKIQHQFNTSPDIRESVLWSDVPANTEGHQSP